VRVFLVNPAWSRLGYSVITPRWLFVMAQATPRDVVGEPLLIDEAIAKFDLGAVYPGDIVEIGISTGNCRAGYDIVRQAKLKGATVIVGGIHPTIFPDEPLEMGADAVVTGNGDLVWPKVVKDVFDHRLQKKYLGGRVPGEALLKARWDLLDPRQYTFPTIQTVAGCPENCSFCSVWVTDGRQPRQPEASAFTITPMMEQATHTYGLHIAFMPSGFNLNKAGRSVGWLNRSLL
jgi:hypothetical protein